MDLILWRHADAEEVIPDDARRLTARGREQARKMADWLAERLPSGYRVITSPAQRARETAAALTCHAVVEQAVSTLATPQGVLEAAGWPDGAGVVIVVGHQPTLGAAAALALTGEAIAWDMSKGAIWWLARRDSGVRVDAMLVPEML